MEGCSFNRLNKFRRCEGSLAGANDNRPRLERGPTARLSRDFGERVVEFVVDCLLAPV
jgi:hypothetical protein